MEKEAALQATLNEKELDLRNLITQANNAINQTNNAINQANSAINTIKTTTATTGRRGLTQLSTSTNVTDPNAYALSATEKNVHVGGSIMNMIAELQTLIARFTNTNGTIPVYINQNLDNLNNSCIVNSSQCSNGPFTDAGTWAFVITLCHGYTNVYRTQICIRMQELSGKSIAVRSREPHGWGSWRFLPALTT